MKINAIRWKKWLTVVAVLGMVALGPGWYFESRFNFASRGQRYFKSLMEERERWSHYRHSNGLHHDLATGKITAGDTVDSLLAQYPKLVCGKYEGWSTISKHGSFGFADTILIAKNGILVKASTGSATFHDEFFNTMQPKDLEDFKAAIQRESHRCQCELRDWYTLSVALTGAAANVEFDEAGQFNFPDLENPPRN